MVSHVHHPQPRYQIGTALLKAGTAMTTAMPDTRGETGLGRYAPHNLQ
jgi:hypothetical protein